VVHKQIRLFRTSEKSDYFIPKENRTAFDAAPLLRRVERGVHVRMIFQDRRVEGGVHVRMIFQDRWLLYNPINRSSDWYQGHGDGRKLRRSAAVVAGVVVGASRGMPVGRRRPTSGWIFLARRRRPASPSTGRVTLVCPSPRFYITIGVIPAPKTLSTEAWPYSKPESHQIK
jgi:hypothetical protein